MKNIDEIFCVKNIYFETLQLYKDEHVFLSLNKSIYLDMDQGKEKLDYDTLCFRITMATKLICSQITRLLSLYPVPIFIRKNQHELEQLSKGFHKYFVHLKKMYMQFPFTSILIKNDDVVPIKDIKALLNIITP